MSQTQPQTNRCAICDKDGMTKDEYCFGCRSFICEDCDKDPAGVALAHEPEEHQKEPEHEKDPWRPSVFKKRPVKKAGVQGGT